MRGQQFYSSNNYSYTDSQLTVTDYRPLQDWNAINSSTVTEGGPNIGSTDRQICVPDIDLADPPQNCTPTSTADGGDGTDSPAPTCPPGCILRSAEQNALYSSQGVISRIKDLSDLQNQDGSEPSPYLLYTSPSPRDGLLARMPSSA